MIFQWLGAHSFKLQKKAGFQWRIQDFPEVRRQFSEGAPTYDFAKSATGFANY